MELRDYGCLCDYFTYPYVRLKHSDGRSVQAIRDISSVYRYSQSNSSEILFKLSQYDSKETIHPPDLFEHCVAKYLSLNIISCGIIKSGMRVGHYFRLLNVLPQSFVYMLGRLRESVYTMLALHSC